MVAAASDLFATHGYAGTTMEAVAASSGMSVQSVYFGFHSKAGLLQAALDAMPSAEATALDADPRRALEALVERALTEHASSGAVALAAASAAPGDEAVAEVLRGYEDRRSQAAYALVLQLRARAPLRRGTTVRRAADVAFGLLSPQLADLMVRQRGWSPRRHAQWCAELLAHTLWD
jgi:AcrR family transcriptional regulator